MNGRYEHDAIRQAVAQADLPGIASRFTKLRKTGKKFEGLCPFHREKSPSFGLYPARTGGGWRWKCLGACNDGGDAIAFLMRAEGLDFRDAVERLGVPAVVTDADRRRMAEQEEANRRAVVRDRGHKVDAARQIWRESVPLAGTPAETYLTEARGLSGPFPESLRFHPSHKHAEDGGVFPCLIAVMSDAHGGFRGVHRTYLAADGRGKAPVNKGAAKKMLGWAEGACVRLDPPAGDVLVAEGLESALSVREATGRPTIAALSLWNLTAPLPPIVRAVTLCVDSDEKDPDQAETAKRAALEAHARRGLTVRLARPPAGMDFNDVLRGVA
jgi:phage/plasmid primase-like uncharacterized protein